MVNCSFNGGLQGVNIFVHELAGISRHETVMGESEHASIVQKLVWTITVVQIAQDLGCNQNRFLRLRFIGKTETDEESARHKCMVRLCKVKVMGVRKQTESALLCLN